uniref:Substrate-binding domain-containing protein n=1 Tax=Phenylobacterium glaciei TaxID=2803784 RepID=A0A974SBP5_9CAUL|nr:substrate-binding domain-containing protein [Phenylobacterium glaciei]
MIYPAALVAGAKNLQAAAFLSFLSGPEAGVVFKKYGFTVLPRR